MPRYKVWWVTAWDGVRKEWYAVAFREGNLPSGPYAAFFGPFKRKSEAVRKAKALGSRAPTRIGRLFSEAGAFHGGSAYSGNPRRRRVMRKRRVRRNPASTVTRFAASRGLAFSESGVLTDVLKDLKALTREPLTRAQANTLNRIAYALGLLKSQAAHGIHENPHGALGASLGAIETLVGVRCNAGNDRNGNPRRVIVIIDPKSSVPVYSLDEGYEGIPRGLFIYLDVDIKPSEYKRLLKRYPDYAGSRSRRNPRGRVRRNPGHLALVGTLNPPLGQAIEVRYRRTIGKHPGYYKHHFTKAATLFAMADGSLRIVGR